MSCAGCQQQPAKAKTLRSQIIIMSIPAAFTLSFGGVVSFGCLDSAHHHQLSFPYVHLLPSLCKAALLQLLASAGASADIFWCLRNSSSNGGTAYHCQNRSGPWRSHRAACRAVTSCTQVRSGAAFHRYFINRARHCTCSKYALRSG